MTLSDSVYLWVLHSHLKKCNLVSSASVLPQKAAKRKWISLSLSDGAQSKSGKLSISVVVSPEGSLRLLGGCPPAKVWLLDARKLSESNFELAPTMVFLVKALFLVTALVFLWWPTLISLKLPPIAPQLLVSWILADITGVPHFTSDGPAHSKASSCECF